MDRQAHLKAARNLAAWATTLHTEGEYLGAGELIWGGYRPRRQRGRPGTRSSTPGPARQPAPGSQYQRHLHACGPPH